VTAGLEAVAFIASSVGGVSAGTSEAGVAGGLILGLAISGRRDSGSWRPTDSGS